MGSAFDFGAGDPGSDLCFILRFLPRQIGIATTNKDGPLIKIQLYGANIKPS